MPEQKPQYYAAQTRTFPLDENEDHYTPRKQRVKRASRFAGIEKLVIKGCDPRYELEVTEAPLLAAQRFNIRLNKEERELLKERPRALKLAINQLYWDVNANGEGSLTPMEKLLIKGCNERHREIVGTDPIGAARQFKIKLTEVDHILLSEIRQQDLSRAINAAKKHLLKGNKCVIGHRLRLQQGRRGRVFCLCAITQPRRDAVETRRRINAVLQELFDPSKPLPSSSNETVFYYREQNETNYFVRKRRARRANRRAQRANERRARRLSSRRAKNLSRSERRRTRTYSPPSSEGAGAGAGPRRRRRRRGGPRAGSEANQEAGNQGNNTSHGNNRSSARGGYNETRNGSGGRRRPSSQARSGGRGNGPGRHSEARSTNSGEGSRRRNGAQGNNRGGRGGRDRDRNNNNRSSQANGHHSRSRHSGGGKDGTRSGSRRRPRNNQGGGNRSNNHRGRGER